MLKGLHTELAALIILFFKVQLTEVMNRYHDVDAILLLLLQLQ